MEKSSNDQVIQSFAYTYGGILAFSFVTGIAVNTAIAGLGAAYLGYKMYYENKENLNSIKGALAWYGKQTVQAGEYIHKSCQNVYSYMTGATVEPQVAGQGGVYSLVV